MEIIEGCIQFIEDPKDRGSISLVNKQCYELDSLTRRKVTIPFCYSINPQRITERFPNLEELTVKGVLKWGYPSCRSHGLAEGWVDQLHRLGRLDSIAFRRMVVRDSDLETIATVMGPRLLSLTLVRCSGFSCDGVSHITRTCTNLRKLILKHSRVIITETTDGEWLHLLAKNNKSLRELDYSWTSGLRYFHQDDDLLLLARNCPNLVSLKTWAVSFHDDKLRDIFTAAKRLKEFCGIIEMTDISGLTDINQLTSFDPFLQMTSFHSLTGFTAYAYNLSKLDLSHVNDKFSHQEVCSFIERTPKLQILQLTDMIGDKGLSRLSENKWIKLKRLCIIRGLLGVVRRDDWITGFGLIKVAQRFHKLECLRVCVTDITNKALECIGDYLYHLKDFRLSLYSNEERYSRDFPLDKGVGALLRGCRNLCQFALDSTPTSGILTHTGLGYIGQHGHNLRMLSLDSVVTGGTKTTDEGLIQLSTGCKRLDSIYLKGCMFTLQALSTASKNLKSLRYMWVEGYRVTQLRDLNFYDMIYAPDSRPCWYVEQTFTSIWCGLLKPYDRKFIAYHSLVGRRADCPKNVMAIGPSRPLSHTDNEDSSVA